MVRDSEKARWYLRDEKLQEVVRQIDAQVRSTSRHVDKQYQFSDVNLSMTVF